MKSQQLIISTFLVLSLLFITARITTAVAPPCSEVMEKAATCAGFAMGKAKAAPPACCNGLRDLAKTVGNVNDKKAICRCLKAGVKNIKGIQDKLLSSIPKACSINVGFPVSLSVNCETIQ